MDRGMYHGSPDSGEHFLNSLRSQNAELNATVEFLIVGFCHRFDRSYDFLNAISSPETKVSMYLLL
jgi:hypothetical protein